MTTIFDMVTDPYERKARVTPGLLVALPVLVPLLGSYGAEHPLLTGVMGLLGGCGAIYALSSVARGRGKKLEEHLVKRWGGMPTTIALRHRDEFLDSVSKQRYHAVITSDLGITLPTAKEEREDPGKADDAYIGATKLIRELTRCNRQLLLKENISYGFHRNMLAMKHVGILSCLIGILYGLLIGGILQLTPPHIMLDSLADAGLASNLTLFISISLLVTWIFYFDQSAVKRMGFVYAERLFECLSSIQASCKN